MAEVNVQRISQAGISPTFTAADAAGDSFANDGRTFIQIKNGGGAAITATVDSVEKCSFGFDHDLVITVAAGGEEIVGPFQIGRFNDATGAVNVSYSDVTSVTVAAFRI